MGGEAGQMSSSRERASRRRSSGGVDERAIRLDDEHRLLLEVFRGILRNGDWFCIPDDARARRLGWSPDPFPVAIHAQPGHPGQAPYGIYVASEAMVNRAAPKDFQPTASNVPPFPGSWGVLSWTHASSWVARRSVRESTNLLDFAIGFQERFSQGV
jgi:hypothetical protein